LQLNILSERASKIAKEARAALDITTDFKPSFEERWRNAIRIYVAEEVEQVSKEVVEEAQEKIDEIETLKALYNDDEEVWICAIYNEPYNSYSLSALEMSRKTGPRFAAEVLKEDTLCLPVDTFKDVIRKLRTSILAGELDEHLHLTAEHLIYNSMKESVRNKFTGIRAPKRKYFSKSCEINYL